MAWPCQDPAISASDMTGSMLSFQASAGACKYEMHEDDLQFDPLLEAYQQLPERDKQRCALNLLLARARP